MNIDKIARIVEKYLFEDFEWKILDGSVCCGGQRCLSCKLYVKENCIMNSDIDKKLSMILPEYFI